jgi:hypothetical protein
MHSPGPLFRKASLAAENALAFSAFVVMKNAGKQLVTLIASESSGF